MHCFGSSKRTCHVRYILLVALATLAVNVILDGKMKEVQTYPVRVQRDEIPLEMVQLNRLKRKLQEKTMVCYDYRQREYGTIKFFVSETRGPLENTQLEFKFRTRRENLILTAEIDMRPSSNSRRDHLVVLLLHGRLYLFADAGQSPVHMVIEKHGGFQDHEWHHVIVTKEMYKIRMLVDTTGNISDTDCTGSEETAQIQSVAFCKTLTLRAGSVSINTNSGIHIMSISVPVLEAVRHILIQALGVGSGAMNVNNGAGCVRDVIVRSRHYLSRDLVHSIKAADPAQRAVPKVVDVEFDAQPENDTGSPIRISGQTFAEFKAAGAKAMVSEKDLHRAPIITGISNNHFEEVVDMIASSHYHMAKKMIIIYNLGLSLHSLNQIKTFCWVKLRNVNLSRYPPHVKWLKACAWKPIIIQAALKEFKAIIYCDASTRFTGHISDLLPLWQSTGILARQTLGPASAYTHSLTYDSFNESAILYRKVAMAAAGVLLISGAQFVRQRIIAPWVNCALRPKCIVPDGLKYPPCKRGKLAYDYRCPRFDQSALTLLLFKAFGNHRLRPAMTELVGNLTKTVRHPTDLYKVQLCR